MSTRRDKTAMRKPVAVLVGQLYMSRGLAKLVRKREFKALRRYAKLAKMMSVPTWVLGFLL